MADKSRGSDPAAAKTGPGNEGDEEGSSAPLDPARSEESAAAATSVAAPESQAPTAGEDLAAAATASSGPGEPPWATPASADPPNGSHALDDLSTQFTRWIEEARRQRDVVVDAAKAEARALLERARDQVRTILEEVEEQRRQAQAHSDAVREHAEAGAAQRLAEADRVLAEANAAREMFARKEAALKESIARLAQDAERLGREALDVAGHAQSTLQEYRRPEPEAVAVPTAPVAEAGPSDALGETPPADVTAANGHNSSGAPGSGTGADPEGDARWSFWRGSRRPE